MNLVLTYVAVCFAIAIVGRAVAPTRMPADWESLVFIGMVPVCLLAAWRARGEERRERWVLLAVAVAALLRGVFFPLTRVHSISMQPNFYAGDYVLFRRPAVPERGDVVLLDSGQGMLLIKRVVAVGGDRIAIRNGMLFLNGSPYAEPYAVRPDPDANLAEITIPEGKLFVLGDNRPQSLDSRHFGVVDRTQVRGKLLWHLPLGRALRER